MISHNTLLPQWLCRRTLPMRNWYRFSHTHRCIAKPDASDITYEELIRTSPTCNRTFVRLHVGHYLWGIDTCSLWQSSACDLSHKQNIVGHYLWGIDTQDCLKILNRPAIQSDITYEELIQTADRRITFFFSMRRIVGHYLWGIDTYYR